MILDNEDNLYQTIKNIRKFKLISIIIFIIGSIFLIISRASSPDNIALIIILILLVIGFLVVWILLLVNIKNLLNLIQIYVVSGNNDTKTLILYDIQKDLRFSYYSLIWGVIFIWSIIAFIFVIIGLVKLSNSKKLILYYYQKQQYDQSTE
ncbi:hypothetical protein [Mycoplasma sp. 1654_15]|uniref:hypothetical protein n=1 Tax=Mycoplasma sp. 1654_15 TaxID=2725994 RepID=UPI0014498A0B|nr:hypothetical protein [Mycoplasma sp. 1654_15]QJB71370.1 hypothetical protein HF996_02715 [Mycoplasma sp. 1654_15]